MLLAERARAARLEDILKLINLTTFDNCSEDFLADQFALALEDQHLALGKADGLQDQADEVAGRDGRKPRRRRAPDAERGSLPGHLDGSRNSGVW